MTEALETRQVGRFTVELHHDPDPMSPRDWDNVGRLTTVEAWTFADATADRSGLYRSARDEAGEPILAIPVDVWSQSYTIVRPGTWDHADGVYWAPLSAVAAEQFADVDGLRSCLVGELDVLNQYLAGEVCGYAILDPDGEHVDSCWGFFGEDYAMAEGESTAKWLDYLAACHWAELPEWVQQTVLILEEA